MICSHARKIGKDIQPIQTTHVETVVQLVRKTPDAYIDLKVDMDELDLTASERKHLHALKKVSRQELALAVISRQEMLSQRVTRQANGRL